MGIKKVTLHIKYVIQDAFSRLWHDFSLHYLSPLGKIYLSQYILIFLNCEFKYV